MHKKIIILGCIILMLGLCVIFDYIKTFAESDKPIMSGSYESLEFWTHSRAYPQKDIPKDKYYEGFEHTQNLYRKSTSIEKTVNSWKAMGPHNGGGRMLSVAVNPLNSKTLYAGSASGGLWRTYDAVTGTGWHRIHTGFPTLGVMGLAINPLDTNVIYIGTGEVYGYNQSIGGLVIRTMRGSYGIGILKTTDGGQTWTKSLDWSYNQEKGVQCIRINPQNPSSIYAGTTDGIYKSVDAGANWQLVLPVLMGEDIIIHPADTNKIMVSCGNLGSTGSGIYRSLDGGVTWSPVSGIPAFSGKTLIDYFVLHPDTVYASVADSLSGRGLYRTFDFGNSWSLVNSQNVPGYQGFFAHIIALHPTDYSQLVWAGIEINKSHDSGVSLTQLSSNRIHVDHHNFARDPNTPDILYIANDGGIWRSNDFGDSYSTISYGLQTTQFYKGFSISAQDSLLAIGGLQDNNSVIYRGTAYWDTVIAGDGCWTAINTLDDNIMYGEYQYLNIYRSTNRGNAFYSATTGLNQSGAAFVAPFVISPSNPNILYAGSRSVFKTTTHANSWFETAPPLDGNPILTLAVSPINPDIVYAATAPISSQAGIFRTTTGGNSWINITGSLPDRYPMDICIDPHDNQNVYICLSGYGSGHVFKSIDAGNNWTDITNNLPDVPTLAIEIDPAHPGYIYVGNDIGVYVSTDSGNTWNTFSTALPEAVMAMDLSISAADRTIWLATHGNGAYKRSLIYKMIKAQNAWINSSFMQANNDTLIVNARYNNPDSINILPNAIIMNIDSTFIDTLALYDDGNHADSLSYDGIYGNYIVPIAFEDIFNVGILTLDSDYGGYLYQPNIGRFTTIGPINYESRIIYAGYQIGPFYKVPIDILVRNNGSTAAAQGVMVELTISHPHVSGIENNYQQIGDIQANTTITCPDSFILSMRNVAQVETIKINFNFYSNNFLYWQDSTNIVVGIENEDKNLPFTYSLKQNYPNPFNPSTTIDFSLPKSEFVTLKIYNILGEEVASLVSDKLNAAKYTYTWDASKLASGIYFYKLESGDYIETRKMILMK